MPRKVPDKQHVPVKTQEYPMMDMDSVQFEIPAGFKAIGITSPFEMAKAALPFYGGTAPTTDAPPAKEREESDGSGSANTSSSDSPAGGVSAEEEPIHELTPEQISKLLQQVTDLNTAVTKLTAENNTYKSKEQQAQRAQQTREQQLEQDLQDAQQIIAKMDAVIRHTAVINAIQGMKDMEFHSARHVMNELNSESFDLDVDLDNGSATVTGIEPELKRIAKECPWLVSKDKTHQPPNQPATTRPRASGSPPVSSGASNDRTTKRAALINKFPVIAHGRAG